MLCPYNSLFFTLLIYFIIFSVWIFVIAECSEDLLLTEIPESSIRKDKLSLLPKRVGNKPSPCTSMLTANRKTDATAPQRAEIIKIDHTGIRLRKKMFLVRRKDCAKSTRLFIFIFFYIASRFPYLS